MLDYSQKRAINLLLWDYYCSVHHRRLQPNAFIENLARRFPEIAEEAKKEAENTVKALDRIKSHSV